jgi:transcriptional regulator with XRE-family HTH domain
MATLAQCIAADRKTLGMSQGDLARRLGVSQQSVAKWEAGAVPRGRHMTDLTKVLGAQSRTANYTTRRGDPMRPPLPAVDLTQADALQTLATAAIELANAARTIAEAVQRLTQPTSPPGKH